MFPPRTGWRGIAPVLVNDAPWGLSFGHSECGWQHPTGG
jgi:hypothetical protein